jgi:hypothetical protein
MSKFYALPDMQSHFEGDDAAAVTACGAGRTARVCTDIRK